MGFFVSCCPDGIKLSCGLSVKNNLNPNPEMNLKKKKNASEDEKFLRKQLFLHHSLPFTTLMIERKSLELQLE